VPPIEASLCQGLVFEGVQAREVGPLLVGEGAS